MKIVRKIAQQVTRWRLLAALESIAAGFALLMFVGMMAYAFQLPWRELLPVFALIGGSVLWFMLRWKNQIHAQALIRYWDQQYPELENSSELLLHQNELNPLEVIQHHRVEQVVNQLPLQVPFTWKWTIFSLIAGLSAGVLSYVVLPKPSSSVLNLSEIVAEPKSIDTPILPKKIHIEHAEIRIQPPKYMRLAEQSVPMESITCYENSRLNFIFTITGKPDRIALILNGKDTLNASENRGKYTAQLTQGHSGFYQIYYRAGEQIFLSDFFTIQVQLDASPSIELSGIKERNEYRWDQNRIAELQIKIQDDFGLNDAYMVATVSKGSGEAVKFREETLRFNQNVLGKKQAEIAYSLDLNTLGMDIGDELYFYITATDNREPKANRSRTEMYFLSIPDTTRFEWSMEGGMAVDQMPEYFRSQRQIIIDTEQLLADIPNIELKTFKNTNQALAEDQKILRLRYGQFLGEEFESGIGPNAVENLREFYRKEVEKESKSSDKEVDKKTAKMFGLQLGGGHYVGDGHDHESEVKSLFEGQDKEHPELSGQSEAQQLLSGYVHAHNEEEEATFFDHALKAKLKSALAQMWESELRLRLYQPKDALPFQYKALELIKEIQQQSRIYVQRTGFEAPPLKPEKRLTGKLDAIGNPQKSLNNAEEVRFPNLRLLYTYLNQSLASNSDSVLVKPSLWSAAGAEVAEQTLKQVGKNNLQLLNALQLAIETNYLPKESALKLQFQIKTWLPKSPSGISDNASHLNPLRERFMLESLQ